MKKLLMILVAVFTMAIDVSGQSIDSLVARQKRKNDTCITNKVPPARIYAAQHGARLNEMVNLTKTTYDSMKYRMDSIAANIVAGGGLTDTASAIRKYVDSLYRQLDSMDMVLLELYADLGAEFDTSTTAQWGAINGKVPYTGATTNVNLGTHSLTANKIVADTVQAKTSMGLHLHSTGGGGIMVGAGGGSNITFDGYPTTTAGDSVLTTNSTGGLLRYDLKGKLSNYLLKNDSITIYATQNGLDTGVRNTRNFVLSKGYGTGTVTTVSVTSANGFAGTVSNATTTPAITLTTTVNGIVKGNGTNLQPATAGTDYLTSSTSTTVITTTNFTTSYTIAATDSRPILITITALANDLTFNAPTGLADGQLVLIRITATGSSRALTWNSAFAPITGPNAVDLPTTVTTTAPATIQFIYNSTSTKMNLAGYVTN